VECCGHATALGPKVAAWPHALRRASPSFFHERSGAAGGGAKLKLKVAQASCLQGAPRASSRSQAGCLCYTRVRHLKVTPTILGLLLEHLSRLESKRLEFPS